MEKSNYIKNVIFDKYRLHKGDGDMWPLTWGADGNIYTAAGDNQGSPLNVWKVSGYPHFFSSVYNDPLDAIKMELLDNMPLHPAVYCNGEGVMPEFGIKPSGIISVGGVLYMGVSNGRYGQEKDWYRQIYTNAWIVTSTDLGKTWNREATGRRFFEGRLGAPSFLQFGKDNEGARDEYVYCYFAATKDGQASWDNADFLLLGRVKNDRILSRESWEFYAGTENGDILWNSDESVAKPVFEYPEMTGQNHVSYNRGIGRYIMGNYSFTDPEGNPRPYHLSEETRYPSQLTLFEAEEPWGPWKLFYKEDNWGTYGDYGPAFPTKWMSEDGKEMYMVSSGSYDDYNFTVQKVFLELF